MSKRVLIVDDEKNMRWVLGQALSGEGFEVAEAADGKEALAAVAELEPDVMVLDHRMPGKDGMEVLRTLRSKDARFPIIMLTAHGNVATAVDAMKAGATEYLTKPFDLEELKLAINKALTYSEMAAEVERLRGELDREYDVQGIVAVRPEHDEHPGDRAQGRADLGNGHDLRRVRYRQGAHRPRAAHAVRLGRPSRSSP